MMEIRRANAKDIPQLLRLLSQVLEIHAKIRPDIFVSGTTKYSEEDLRLMVANDSNPIYVIGEGEKVYGYAFCQSRIPKFASTMKRKKTFHIDDFCIDEACRGKHLGQALFAFLIEEGKRLGYDEITLNSWEGNEAANAFYEKMGMKTRSRIMDLPLTKE